MQVREVMSTPVALAAPDHTVQEAAWLMREVDTGALPVGDGDRLVGMITDRDIALRGIGAGKGPQAAVREVMTADVRYCFEDEEVAHVAINMGEEQIRRLPVVDRSKRLVGILSLSDVAMLHSAGTAGNALGDIGQPGGKHTHV